MILKKNHLDLVIQKKTSKKMQLIRMDRKRGAHTQPREWTRSLKTQRQNRKIKIPRKMGRRLKTKRLVKDRKAQERKIPKAKVKSLSEPLSHHRPKGMVTKSFNRVYLYLKSTRIRKLFGSEMKNQKKFHQTFTLGEISPTPEER